MKQKAVQNFESECGRVKVFVDHEMPVGAFHDFLFELKGKMIQIMKDAQEKKETPSENVTTEKE